MTSTDVEQGDVAGTEVARTTPKKVRRKPHRYNWDAIRTAYVEGVVDEKNPDERQWGTLADVAAMFDAGANRVREKSADEHWPEQRVMYQKQLTERRQRKRASELGKAAVDLDSKALNVSKLGIAMVTTRLAEIAQEVQARAATKAETQARIEAGLPVEAYLLKPAVDARELDTLGRAAEQFHRLGLRALGEDIIKHEITGKDGGPIETEVKTISERMYESDAERLAAILNAVRDVGTIVIDEAIEDADLVEDDDQQQELEA